MKACSTKQRDVLRDFVDLAVRETGRDIAHCGLQIAGAAAVAKVAQLLCDVRCMLASQSRKPVGQAFPARPMARRARSDALPATTVITRK